MLYPPTIPRGNVTETEREIHMLESACQTHRDQTRGACAWALGGYVSLRFTAFDSNCFEVSLRSAAFDSNCFKGFSCKN